MAYIFKPTYKKPDGTQAEVSKWYIRYQDASGRTRTVAGYTDMEATEQRMRDLTTAVARGKEGIIDRKNPPRLAGLLESYRRHLEANRMHKHYIRQTVARISAILAGTKATHVGDLDADRVAYCLHELRQDRPRPELDQDKEEYTGKELVQALGARPAQLARVLRREGLAATGTGRARRYPKATVEALQAIFLRGISVATSNGHLSAIKGFTRWLVGRHIDRDPLDNLKKLSGEDDVRHARRALTESEIRALLTAANTSQATVHGLTGEDRMFLYGVAMVTGFRASELSSLLPSSFDLGSTPATATCKAAYTKNKAKAAQPLPDDIANGLRRYLASKSPRQRVWAGKWNMDAAEMLRVDLRAAGIPYRNDNGEVADFHALRHSYVTLLGRTGVPLTVLQRLARHSDPRLTANVYSHVDMEQRGGAVQGLPALLPLSAPLSAASDVNCDTGGLPDTETRTARRVLLP